VTDPKRTVRLLDELEFLGFNDRAFSLIHHFPDETIARHRDYCMKVQAFQADGSNERVQRRLELVLRTYWAGGFRSGKAEVWEALSKAAVAEIPGA
jgi:hypothetical protein